MKKWIVPISLALALAACNDVKTTAPVAQSQNQQVKATAAAGVTVTTGDTGNYGTSFNGRFTITNPNATATTWTSLKVKLPAGSGISGTPWGAAGAISQDASGYYTILPNTWGGQNIGANASITISYSGTGSNSKATECYLDGSTVNLCGTTVVADTTAPTASLVASSTSVTAAGSVTFTATAADNVGVTKVEFYEGTTLLASKTAAPFTNSVSYTSANNGTKSYTVKAFDAAGNVTTSSAVSVVVNIATVVNPSVTLAASSTSVTTASTLTLTATPANITPSKVEFYSGTTLIATKTAAPYTHAIALTSANNGAKTFTAKVYSAASTTAAATSAAVNVNVNIATTPAITLAASSTSITTASTLTLTATPSNVTPSKVKFYSGTTLIATKTAAPYTHAIALTSANNGAKTFTAKVYSGTATTAAATSAAVNVNVAIGVADTTKPTASLAASSTNVTAAGSVTFTATATDNVGVAKVEFYDGTTLLATDTTAPYTNSVSYTSANNGTKSYTAKAFDAAGNNITSAAVSVVVNIAAADTTAPTVSLSSSSASVTAAGSITLTANASDNVGVSRVEFYRGSTLISSPDTTSPYTVGLNLTSADNGTLSLTAKAFDAAGNVATSSAVSVVVNIGGTLDNEACRPDGLFKTPGINVPYCLVYDTNGREKLPNNLKRRVIGYFTNWRTGKNDQPSYLPNNIPWSKLSHINYAFAHIDGTNKVSVGTNLADKGNSSTGMVWDGSDGKPSVPGAEMDPAYSYKGNFNLLNKFKKQNPGVRTLVSIGGWAETGGYFADDGSRVASGGYYSMTTNADGSINTAGINTFADSVVTFLRTYNFDGADLDYEYPTTMNQAGNPLDWAVSGSRLAGLQASYNEMLRVLRAKLDAAAAADGKYYMLTIASPSSAYLLRGMENFAGVKYLDYVNMMTYDLHGAWNEFVGPNAALFDDGKDGELAKWSVYSTAQYGGIGYLNTDWAYRYFRGSLPAGRINVGVPYYTRGWKDVTGGNNGLWGTSATTTDCGPGLTKCGTGAVGIDNIWHDLDANGKEMGAGSNPMWHAMNLEKGIAADYLPKFKLTAADLVGTYARNYDATLVAPWLWNANKKVFLSTEDTQSMAVKAKYILDNGIGGAMFWELAGDYDWYPAANGGKGQYYIGNSLTSTLHSAFSASTATPYGNKRAKTAMPTSAVNVEFSLTNFKLGDQNYPINPYLKLTNKGTTALPGGTVVEFDYPVSAPNNMADQSGAGLTVVSSEHTFPGNIGGYKGDFNHAKFTIPAWQSIAPGASIEITLNYFMPISGPSNYVLTVNGTKYATSQEYDTLPVVNP